MSSDPLLVVLVLWFLVVILINQLGKRIFHPAIGGFRSGRWFFSGVLGMLITLLIFTAILLIGEQVSKTTWTTIASATLVLAEPTDESSYLFLPESYVTTDEQWMFFTEASPDGALVPTYMTNVMPTAGGDDLPRIELLHGEPAGWWKYLLFFRETKYDIYIPPEYMADLGK